ncbi:MULTISPECIES: ABC transporter ATP-binding protein [unclassified Caulobacter]|jgi:ABC-2 type transport system ATP-binding protein|uniref:ABC transporter ATP-binding protein n=1 Tax=unclassified Caulobacter TaxID=2648921 RepID=UPI000780D5E7|nr:MULTISPECIES: ABC transporter ATP-binding protein [unclassified Caulobacter]AZS20778.1 ABC transporter ATP-binding protein [Caulobacter sp. FWC26]
MADLAFGDLGSTETEPTMSPQSPQPPIAILSKVLKRRGATLALNGLDLAIRPGQCVALLGPNGAGKSTSVALLTGRLRPDAGEAFLFGGDPRTLAGRGRMGVMLQTAGLPNTLSVREQIDLFRGYYRKPRPLEEIVELAGLEGLERRRCGALSGGQQRRVQFALAISGRPDFLVLDEPTTGMDIDARRALWSAVRSEIGRGAAVLLTTHHLDEAEALADRIVVIDHGQVIADGTPEAIKARVSGVAIRCRTRLSDAELASLARVTGLSRDGGKVTLLTTSAPATLRELLARDETVDDLTVSGASLEDAVTRLVQAGQAAAHQRQPEVA